jgi:hypothetical protein
MSHVYRLSKSGVKKLVASWKLVLITLVRDHTEIGDLKIRIR